MRRILGFALGTILCATLAAAATMAADSPYTVGDLAVRLAKMVTDKPGYTPEGAVAVLGRLGVELEGELDARVTEAYLVDAFNQLGTNLTTSNPDHLVTGDEAKKVFRLFDHGLGAVEGLECPPGFPGSSCNAAKCTSDDTIRCITDTDCPDGGFCRTPPGIAKKLGSPSDDGLARSRNCEGAPGWVRAGGRLLVSDRVPLGGSSPDSDQVGQLEGPYRRHQRCRTPGRVDDSQLLVVESGE